MASRGQIAQGGRKGAGTIAIDATVINATTIDATTSFQGLDSYTMVIKLMTPAPRREGFDNTRGIFNSGVK